MVAILWEAKWELVATVVCPVVGGNGKEVSVRVSVTVYLMQVSCSTETLEGKNAR